MFAPCKAITELGGTGIRRSSPISIPTAAEPEVKSKRGAIGQVVAPMRAVRVVTSSPEVNHRVS